MRIILKFRVGTEILSAVQFLPSLHIKCLNLACLNCPGNLTSVPALEERTNGSVKVIHNRKVAGCIPELGNSQSGFQITNPTEQILSPFPNGPLPSVIAMVQTETLEVEW